jgi:hypothetical protein
MLPLLKILEQAVVDLDAERLRRAMIDMAESEIEWYDILLGMIDAMREKFQGSQKQMLAAAKEPKPVRNKNVLKKHVEKAGNWKDWYQNNYAYVKTLFGDNEEHSQKFLKILAATSMAAKVDANATMALNAFKSMILDGKLAPEEFKGLEPVKANLSKIAHGQDIEGPKVGPYSKALAGNPDEIAVDRHIFEIIFGKTSESEIKRQKAKQIIAEIAKDMGLENRQIQAALWAANQIRKKVTPQNYIEVIEKKKKDIQQMVEQLKSRQ